MATQNDNNTQEASSVQQLVSRYIRFQKPYENTDAGKKTKRKYTEKIYYPKTCADCGTEAIYDDEHKIQNGRILANRSRLNKRRIFVCHECG